MSAAFLKLQFSEVNEYFVNICIYIQYSLFRASRHTNKKDIVIQFVAHSHEYFSNFLVCSMEPQAKRHGQNITQLK